MVYTLTLNPALDYVTDVASFGEGVNRSESSRIFYGGKGINVSAVLARLGTESTALGFAAGFTGRELVSLLENDGIKSDFVFTENGSTRINVKIRSDKEYDVNAAGPDVDKKELDALISKLSALKSGDVLVLSGSVPPSLGDGVYERILGAASASGVKTVVDAEGELLKGALKHKPFLVKPNHLELGGLFGARAETDEEVAVLAERVIRLGAENVLVSRAEKGAVLVTKSGGVLSCPAVKGGLVSSTGCGDSMLAGFIHSYLRDGDFERALKLAIACGSAAAFTCALPEKENILKIYNSLG